MDILNHAESEVFSNDARVAAAGNFASRLSIGVLSPVTADPGRAV
jgi:hypothetical protein